MLASRIGGVAALPHPRLLSEHGLLAIVLGGVALAGWPSWRALFALGSGDTPLSFMPLVVLIGVALLLYRFDAAAISARPHDDFVDGLVLIALVVASTVLLVLLPVTMSWDYWLARLDVPGMVLLLSALIVAIWGLAGLRRLLPPLLYLLLAWPLPFLLLYNRLIPWLTAVTSTVARFVAPVLLHGVLPDPANAAALMVTYHGKTTDLVIAQGCAGMNGALGLVVIALPLAVMGRGSWEARGVWLTLGLGLSWLANLARILLISGAATLWGPHVALSTIHPVLGIILFAVSFALLLALAPLCSLDVRAPFRARRRLPAAPRRARGPRRLVAVLALLACGAAVESNLAQFGWVVEAALPRVGLAQASDLFHAPPGWRVRSTYPVDGWQAYFGPTTLAAVATVTSPTQRRVDVQTILTRDAASFGAYGVENCYTFHGFTLRAVHHVALGRGITATIVDLTQGTVPVAALYWLQPVQTPRGLYHERVVLIAAGQNYHAFQSRKEAAPAVAAQPVQGLATGAIDLLSPWPAGDAGQAFTPMELELGSLARALVVHETVASGGANGRA